MRAVMAVIALLISTVAIHAEHRVYGEVDLTGLARESWPLNPPGLQNAMVCNVNGPDGFLTVRSGPDTSFDKVRAFGRLVILEVDTSQRRGNWIYVQNAYRTVTKDGISQPYKPLPVKGWAHDSYMCDFIH